MTIHQIIPSGLRDRLRSRLHRSPVTQIANWDTLTPLDLPQPDIDQAKAKIAERIQAHEQAGSLDDAYGDILDRLIRPLCRRWAQDTAEAYRKQLTVWDYIEDQGTEHNIALGLELSRLNDESARHQKQLEEAWSNFEQKTDTALPGEPTVAEVPQLQGLAGQHPELSPDLVKTEAPQPPLEDPIAADAAQTA